MWNLHFVFVVEVKIFFEIFMKLIYIDILLLNWKFRLENVYIFELKLQFLKILKISMRK